MTRRWKLVIALAAFALVANAPLALVHFNKDAIEVSLKQSQDDYKARHAYHPPAPERSGDDDPNWEDKWDCHEHGAC